MQRNIKWVLHPNMNYTDRKVYKLDDQEIEQYTLWEEENKTFIVGDMLSAQVLTTPPISVFNSFPNYVLVYKGTQLESRYFVTQFSAFRGDTQEEDSAQFSVSLARDVLVDFADKYKDKQFKCTRGYLNDEEWSPLLVQPEGISPNQIKVKQTNLRMWDGDTNWLTIFYDSKGVKKGSSEEYEPIELKFDYVPKSQYTLNQLQNDFKEVGIVVPDSGLFNKIIGTSGFAFENYNYKTVVQSYNSATITGETILFNNNSDISANIRFYGSGGTRNETFTANNSQSVSSIYNKLNNQYGVDIDVTSLYNKYNNTIVGNKICKVEIVDNRGGTGDELQVSNDDIKTILEFTQVSLRNHIGGLMDTGIIVNNYGTVKRAGNRVLNVSFQNVSVETYTMKLPIGITLTEANVGCVSIPFGENTQLIVGENTYSLSVNTIFSLGNKGFTSVGSLIYDVQLLPYCPVNYLSSEHTNQEPTNDLTISDFSMLSSVPIKNSKDEAVYYGFTIEASSGSMYVKHPITSKNLKMDSITKMYRLVSQNHQQAYEFNPVNNNGISYFFVEYTVKPNNTIFRICPIFNENSLNGGNYRDVRGLVWSSGFSLPQVKDQWVEYQLQNSTYQEMFDRSIEYESVTNSIRNTQAWTSLAIGGVTSIAQGAMGAGLAFGAYNKGMNIWNAKNAMFKDYVSKNSYYDSDGNQVLPKDFMLQSLNLYAQKPSFGNTASSILAASGASGLGGVLSGIAGQIANQKLQREAIQYKKDQFALQNQAIQARPNTFASGTEYSILNAKKAYIEEYDCTPTEKSLIQYYLYMNSYAVNSLGLIEQFLRPSDMTMLQGSFWFFDDIPAQIGNYINEQFSTGVYIMDSKIFEVNNDVQ